MSARNLLTFGSHAMRLSPKLLSGAVRRVSSTSLLPTWEYTRVRAGLPVHTSFAWLRDACPCPSCIHPSTRQKLHQTSSIPAHLSPAEAPRVTEDAMHIAWPDGHRSTYPLAYLARYTSNSAIAAFRSDPVPAMWADAATVQSSSNLRMEYANLNTDEGLLAALEQLTTYGLLFMRNVPHARTSAEDCELERLAARLGEVRETFYGRTWDVRNVRQSTNIAYTNLDLGLHMDLLYFEHPPRYQILHCLRNRVRGGASYFVDARAAARRLSARDIAQLARAPITFAYVNAGHHLHHAHPTLELAPPPPGAPDPLYSVAFDAPDAAEGADAEVQRALAERITHINYSPPFQAPLPPDTPPQLFGALARFAEQLARPAAWLTHTLAEGEAVLFDNRRILHARTAFEDVEIGGGEGETSRWLKGCYFEADALLDQRRVLLEKLSKSGL